eukprot:COSAG04_NODE_649_length_11584_cov_241.553069_4_plen_249_part_00
MHRRAASEARAAVPRVELGFPVHARAHGGAPRAVPCRRTSQHHRCAEERRRAELAQDSSLHQRPDQHAHLRLSLPLQDPQQRLHHRRPEGLDYRVSWRAAGACHGFVLGSVVGEQAAPTRGARPLVPIDLQRLARNRSQRRGLFLLHPSKLKWVRGSRRHAAEQRRHPRHFRRCCHVAGSGWAEQARRYKFPHPGLPVLRPRTVVQLRGFVEVLVRQPPRSFFYDLRPALPRRGLQEEQDYRRVGGKL